MNQIKDNIVESLQSLEIISQEKSESKEEVFVIIEE